VPSEIIRVDPRPVRHPRRFEISRCVTPLPNCTSPYRTAHGAGGCPRLASCQRAWDPADLPRDETLRAHRGGQRVRHVHHGHDGRPLE